MVTNGLQALSSICIEDKRVTAIEELEKTGKFANEIAELKFFQQTYGGALASLAADIVLEMWTDVSSCSSSS